MRNAIGFLVGVGVLATVVTGCSSSGGGSVLGGGRTGVAASGTSGTSGTAPEAGASTTAVGSHSSAPGAPAAASRDVCALLSAAEASRLNHVPYRGTTARHVAANFDECTYGNAGNAPDPVDIQNLHVKVIAIPDCFAQLKTSDGTSGGHPVPGVGDEALGYSIGLLVRAGSTCVDINGLTHAELQGNWTPDVAMAKLILGRLH